MRNIGGLQQHGGTETGKEAVTYVGQGLNTD
jgi:hypothetical protein